MRLATSVPVGEQRRAVDFIVKLSIGIKRERGGKGSQAPEPERFLKPHLSLILNWQWAKRPFVLFGRRAHLILLVVTETRGADRPCTGATGTGVLRRPAREFSEISLQPLPAVAIHFDEAGHPLTKTSPLNSRKGREASRLTPASPLRRRSAPKGRHRTGPTFSASMRCPSKATRKRCRRDPPCRPNPTPSKQCSSYITGEILPIVGGY